MGTYVVPRADGDVRKIVALLDQEMGAEHGGEAAQDLELLALGRGRFPPRIADHEDVEVGAEALR